MTVVADREGDIYEDFALRPEGVHLLVRAAQDRALAEGGTLFGAMADIPELGRMSVELPSAPGRAARTAHLALRVRQVGIRRPANRVGDAARALPKTVPLTLVEARELDPPAGATPAHWRPLTSHRVPDLEQARYLCSLYRARWTIEQVFRTLKTQGFDVEALRIADPRPFQTLVAAISVMQMVNERDGIAGLPLAQAFMADDQPILEALSLTLEGKTQRQKNPHPKASLAFAAWVCAKLGGWTGYYGKPGPIVIYNGLLQFNAIRKGHNLRKQV